MFSIPCTFGALIDLAFVSITSFRCYVNGPCLKLKQNGAAFDIQLDRFNFYNAVVQHPQLPCMPPENMENANLKRPLV